MLYSNISVSFFIFSFLSLFPVLRTLLNVGASVEWHNQLKAFVNNNDGDMDAAAILDYFSPLIKHLEDYNVDNKINVGGQRLNFIKWVI